MNQLMVETAEKLEKLSLELDKWATRLKNEGWSTVQVEWNIEQAHGCAMQALKIRQAIKGMP